MNLILDRNGNRAKSMEKLCFKSYCQKLILRVMRLFHIPAMVHCEDEEQTFRDASECETEGGFCHERHVRADISQAGPVLAGPTAVVLVLKEGI